MDTVAEAHPFAAVFSHLTIFTADSMSSYPDGGCRNHMGVAPGSCTLLLLWTFGVEHACAVCREICIVVILLVWGRGIPFHVIGRKYTEGTDSWPHAYNTLSVYGVRHGKNPYKKCTVMAVLAQWFRRLCVSFMWTPAHNDPVLLAEMWHCHRYYTPPTQRKTRQWSIPTSDDPDRMSDQHLHD